MDRSIAEYFYSRGEPEGHRCGYCKSQDGSVSRGMWTHRLTVEDYQDLIDRGWRRSGKYCYKPLMSRTCCPLYTISCQATKFALSKSQKDVLKKMNKYLEFGKQDKEAAAATPEGSTEREASKPGASDTVGATSKAKKPVQPGKGADPTKPPCQKAKVMRQERKKEKSLSSHTGISGKAAGAKEVIRTSSKVAEREGESADPLPDFMKVGPDGRKPLEAFLSAPGPDKPHAHRLELKLVRSHPPSDDFKATFKESHALFKKYQMSVHKEAEGDCKESDYRRFLCDSPLIPRKGQEGWPCDYGSYHQHYRIDGKLVAVGVIDVLPHCLSSVYLYYDPDISFLSFGVYSALRELGLTRRLHLADPAAFKYYYMGYYVHSCQKMRYKGNYSPSFLLCPESYKFVPIKPCLPKLDASKYSRLNDEQTPPEDVQGWVNDTLVLVDRTFMNYRQFTQFTQFVPQSDRQEGKVKQYAELVGPKVASRMLLVLDN